MTRFCPNPVVIKNNGKPYRIIELTLDYNDRPFILEVYKDNSLILKEEVNENSLLSVDKNIGYVRFVYKDLNGDYIKEEVINTNLNPFKKEVKNQEKEIEQRLKELIKQEMDFPKGTETEISKHTELLKKTTSDKDARIYVMSKIRKLISSTNLIKDDMIEEWAYKLYSDLYGMDVIQELDDDIEVGEIMVNAVTYPKFDSSIYYVKNQEKFLYNKKFDSLKNLINIFNRTIEFTNTQINAVDKAIIEATRHNKDRVNIIVPGASDNYIMNIRKFSNFLPNLQMMKQKGTVDDYIDKLLSIIVRGKANIGVGGAMNTGKTTMINFMLTYTQPIERKVVIASVAETDIDRVLKGHDICILNVDEEKDFSFSKLLKASLRTTADRIIVPEARGKEFREVYEANVKTKGNMFSGHALDDDSFLDACTDMYMSGGISNNENSEYVKNKLCKAIDIVLIMRQVGKSIRIKSISEVLMKNNKYVGMNKLYEWKYNPEKPLEGWYERTSNRLSPNIKQRLNEMGIPMSEMEDL